jgi:glycosyltransferase A (GT-A) superfamily protein (DUF2064 family)
VSPPADSSSVGSASSRLASTLTPACSSPSKLLFRYDCPVLTSDGLAQVKI